MPHSWFVLVRLFIRVDDVLFRLYDVRLYHAFGSGEIVRETWGMEADYEAVKRVGFSRYRSDTDKQLIISVSRSLKTYLRLPTPNGCTRSYPPCLARLAKPTASRGAV